MPKREYRKRFYTAAFFGNGEKFIERQQKKYLREIDFNEDGIPAGKFHGEYGYPTQLTLLTMRRESS